MGGLCILCLAALCQGAEPATSASSPASQPGKVFELKRESVSKQGLRIPCMRRGVSVTPTAHLPEGIKAAEGEAPLVVVPIPSSQARTRSRGKVLQAADGYITLGSEKSNRYRVIIVRSEAGIRWCDRLYVDANADGTFGEGESWDIRSTNGSVTVETDQKNYRHLTVESIALVQSEGERKIPYWITVDLYQYIQNLRLAYRSDTLVVGKAAFGDKTHLVGIYDAGCKGRFDGRVELPPAGGENAMKYWPVYACQILVDVDGDGRFQSSPRPSMELEHRWLTRLIRYSNHYYDIAVQPDGSSLCVTPTTPKTGTLKPPQGIVSGDLMGPECAMVLPGNNEPIRLPVGRYVVSSFTYRQGLANLLVYDRSHQSQFEVREDQEGTFSAGPPLELRTEVPSSRLRRQPGKTLTHYIQLEAFDCAGREVASMSGKMGMDKPVPPKFKIVDSSGKTVHSGQFEFG